MTDMAEPDRDAARQMWHDYLASQPAQFSGEESLPDVDGFGDSRELADELIALVLDGIKRATAGLVADYEAAGEPLPGPGDHWVACDGAGVPRAVLRTTEVRVGHLDSVDDAFAYDEGEGDRSREAWLAGHRAFASRRGAALGIATGDDSMMAFERFEVVWQA